MKYRLRDNFSTSTFQCMNDILKNRGVEDIENFINPSAACELNPYTLNNIDMAAKTLLFHLENKSKILLPIDADADGYTSASILWLYIKDIYPNADLHFTVHEHKQHGLEDKIDWILEQDFNLVVIPDAGSFDIKYHQQLHEAGIECIVLDHHTVPQDDNGNDIFPNEEYAIVVNNQLSPYKNKALCGAGVTYKFCEVLDDLLHINKAQQYIDLAALGEIADVMDKTNTETNYIIIEGLKNIRNEGFRTLIETQAYSLKEKAYYPYEGLTSTDIAFYIAPLINAIVRVGSMVEKENLFYCFVDPQKNVQSTKRGAKPGDTETAAEQTARVGKNAKARQDRIKEQAMSLIDFKIQKNELDRNNIIIIELTDDDNIPQEMTGLIAMNVVSKYQKPAMLGRRSSKNELSGSIRSDSNFAGLPSFKKFLEESGLVNFIAGHDNAAGWNVSGNKINALLDYANTHLSAEDFENCYLVDYVLDANDNNYDLLYVLSSHPEYFGNHIEEIKVVIKNVPLATILIMGANKDSIKISYNNVDYVKFKDLDFIEEVMNNRMKKLNIYGRINLNTFNGKTTVQCLISDYEFAEDLHKYDF